MTVEQYRQAVEDTRSCMEGEGYTSAGVLLTFSWEGAKGASGAYDACYDEHLKQTEHYWFHSNVPTGSAREEMFGRFSECVEESGISGVTFTSKESMVEILDSIAEQIDTESPEFDSILLCIDDYRLLYPEGVLPL